MTCTGPWWLPSLECSGHGVCHSASELCVCDSGWGGKGDFLPAPTTPRCAKDNVTMAREEAMDAMSLACGVHRSTFQRMWWFLLSAAAICALHSLTKAVASSVALWRRRGQELRVASLPLERSKARRLHRYAVSSLLSFVACANIAAFAAVKASQGDSFAVGSDMRATLHFGLGCVWLPFGMHSKVMSDILASLKEYPLSRQCNSRVDVKCSQLRWSSLVLLFTLTGVIIIPICLTINVQGRTAHGDDDFGGEGCIYRHNAPIPVLTFLYFVGTLMTFLGTVLHEQVVYSLYLKLLVQNIFSGYMHPRNEENMLFVESEIAWHERWVPPAVLRLLGISMDSTRIGTDDSTTQERVTECDPAGSNNNRASPTLPVRNHEEWPGRVRLSARAQGGQSHILGLAFRLACAKSFNRNLGFVTISLLAIFLGLGFIPSIAPCWVWVQLFATVLAQLNVAWQFGANAFRNWLQRRLEQLLLPRPTRIVPTPDDLDGVLSSFSETSLSCSSHAAPGVGAEWWAKRLAVPHHDVPEDCEADTKTVEEHHRHEGSLTSCKLNVQQPEITELG